MQTIRSGLTLLLLPLCLLAASALAELSFEPSRSRIEFTGFKPGKSHSGGFRQFTATGNIDWTDLSASKVRIEIDARSLWSDDGGLTTHLKSADFFHVAKYPAIVFETTNIEIRDPRNLVVSGALTLLDKTEEIVAPCKLEFSDKGLVVKTTLRIDRKRWGMTYGAHIEPEVEIAATLVFGRE